MNGSEFIIPASHPSLPGHFPGNPIVPGVIVLERVVEAVQCGGLGPVAAVRRCKFVAPLRPGEACTVEFTTQGADVRFVCRNATGVVARGVLQTHHG